MEAYSSRSVIPALMCPSEMSSTVPPPGRGDAGLLAQSTQSSGADVGAAARDESANLSDRLSLVDQRTCRHHHLGLLVEGDQPEVISRLQPLDQGGERGLRALQRRTVHRAAA